MVDEFSKFNFHNKINDVLHKTVEFILKRIANLTFYFTEKNFAGANLCKISVKFLL